MIIDCKIALSAYGDASLDPNCLLMCISLNRAADHPHAFLIILNHDQCLSYKSAKLQPNHADKLNCSPAQLNCIAAKTLQINSFNGKVPTAAPASDQITRSINKDQTSRSDPRTIWFAILPSVRLTNRSTLVYIYIYMYIYIYIYIYLYCVYVYVCICICIRPDESQRHL